MTSFLGTSASKWWGNSLTIQGALVTAASALLPAIGGMIGIDVDSLRILGSQTVNVVQAFGALVGSAMTVIGRTRAYQPLAQQSVTVRI